MLRWAYEIHTTFVVPGSPLNLLQSVCVSCHDNHQSIIVAVDEILLKEDRNREDVLRDIFLNARVIAVEAIKLRLLELQQKRVQGLGNVFAGGSCFFFVKEEVKQKYSATKWKIYFKNR